MINTIKNKKIPHNWCSVQISDVVEILDSQRIPINATERQKRKDNIPTECLVPYYGATGQVDWIDDYIFNDELVLLA